MYVTRAALAVLAAATIAWAARPTTSIAYDYHPLEVGCQWVYDNPNGGLHTMSITGERIVLGAVTRVRHQIEDDQEYENYWTKDTAGNLFIHGAYNYDGFEIAYLPPIAMVMAPLYVTKTWVTENIYLYDLDGAPWGGDPMDYPLRVYSEGLVTVPAGQFYAYGVGYDIGPALALERGGKRYDLVGRALGTGEAQRDDNTTDWYSDGVGEVLFGYIYGDIFPLRTFEAPVPVRRTTWGRVRTLYR